MKVLELLNLKHGKKFMVGVTEPFECSKTKGNFKERNLRPAAQGPQGFFFDYVSSPPMFLTGPWGLGCVFPPALATFSRLAPGGRELRSRVFVPHDFNGGRPKTYATAASDSLSSLPLGRKIPRRTKNIEIKSRRLMNK